VDTRFEFEGKLGELLLHIERDINLKLLGCKDDASSNRKSCRKFRVYPTRGERPVFLSEGGRSTGGGKETTYPFKNREVDSFDRMRAKKAASQVGGERPGREVSD